jgi:glutamyl-tRNA reductase
LREQLSFPADRLADGLALLGRHAAEGMILSTCNRVEVYAVVSGQDPHDAVSRLTRFVVEATGVGLRDVESATVALTDDAAVRHLFRVAAGLESMVLGEPQILGQIRDALGAARSAGIVGPFISRLATDALKVGKQARTHTDIARNKTSIAHAAVALAAREFTAACPILVALDRMDLERMPCPAPVAHVNPLRGRTAVVIGAGPMGTLAAKLLRTGQVGRLLIANRTRSRAETLAAQTGGEAIALDQLPDVLAMADLAIAATAGDRPVITPATMSQVRRTGAPLVLMDVGLPRCVDPAVADDSRVLLRDVDALEEIAAGYRSGQAAEIIHVEHLIADGLRQFRAWHEGRQVSPTIAALRERADELREIELCKAFSRLGHLSDRDREVVAALAAGLTNKLLHTPTSNLTRADSASRLDDAAALARLFGLEAPGVIPPVAPVRTESDNPGACPIPVRASIPAD